MTIGQTIRGTVHLISLAGATAVAGVIVLLAPEVGREVLLALIGGWTVLAAVRVLVLLGYARKVYQRLEAAHAVSH